MAERSVSAFNRDYQMPHVQVFADRNRVEREETFELPAAARDRFMMEISINTPADDEVLDQLMFDPRFHDVDSLVSGIDSSIIAYYQLNELAVQIQQNIQTSPTLHRYALALWKASSNPGQFGIQLSDVNMSQLMLAGASPRGMSYFIRAAKVRAWLEGRAMLLPEDMQAVFQVTMEHRIFLNPIYGYRREELMPGLINGILEGIAAP
jgi:MoxR-like ATPase